MHSKEKSTKLGFTLMELLTVVAIIAVLTAVAISVFSSQTRRAEEAVCIANRRAWYGVLMTNINLYGQSSEEYTIGYVGYTSSKDEYKQFTCPSGGTLSYTVKTDGSIEMSCSEHKAIMYNAGTVLSSMVESMLDKLGSFNASGTKHIDSNAVNNNNNLEGWTDKVKGSLPQSFKDNAPTWVVIKSKSGAMQFVWSTVAIDNEDIGTNIPVLCYDKNSGKYSVGESKVEKHGSYDYPVIAKDLDSYVTSDEQTGLEFEEAVIIYNRLLAAY